MQEIARWLLARLPRYPLDERFEIIVGWSAPVRPRQGQIFKVIAGAGELALLPTCPTHREYEAHTHHAVLLGHWAKDVFPS